MLVKVALQGEIKSFKWKEIAAKNKKKLKFSIYFNPHILQYELLNCIKLDMLTNVMNESNQKIARVALD